MANSESVYKERLRLDSKRQPQFSDSLVDLNRGLRRIARSRGLVQPYALDETQKKSLASGFEGYAKGGAGIAVGSVSERFVYRLASFGSILKPPNMPVNSVADTPMDEVHDQVLSRFQRTSDWIPLSRLIFGRYSGWRAITWWSSREASIDSVLAHAYSVGIPRNWVAERSVFLRCRTEDLLSQNALRIPTCLDAFDSPIFYAVSDETTSSGQAIDLTELENLQSRESEYVALGIDCDTIDFVPVVRERRVDEDYCLESLWPRLEAFYRDQ